MYCKHCTAHAQGSTFFYVFLAFKNMLVILDYWYVLEGSGKTSSWANHQQGATQSQLICIHWSFCWWSSERHAPGLQTLSLLHKKLAGVCFSQFKKHAASVRNALCQWDSLQLERNVYVCASGRLVLLKGFFSHSSESLFFLIKWQRTQIEYRQSGAEICTTCSNKTNVCTLVLHKSHCNSGDNQWTAHSVPSPLMVRGPSKHRSKFDYSSCLGFTARFT